MVQYAYTGIYTWYPYVYMDNG